MSNRLTPRNIEIAVLTIVFFIFLFLNVNFDPRLGVVYSIMIIFAWLTTMSDKHLEIPLIREYPINWRNIILYTLMGFAGYLMLAEVASLVFGAGLAGTIIKSTAHDVIPALQGSQTIKFIVYGFFIPYVETISFLRITEFVMDFTHTKFGNWKDISMQSTFVFIAAIFALFHLSVGLIKGPGMLILAWVFMLVSLNLAAWRKQGLEAVLMHVVNNTFVFAVAMSFAPAMSLVGVL